MSLSSEPKLDTDDSDFSSIGELTPEGTVTFPYFNFLSPDSDVIDSSDEFWPPSKSILNPFHSCNRERRR